MNSTLSRSVSQFAPRPLHILLLLLLSFLPPTALSVNVTTLLADHPDYSAFSRLLVATSVADDLARRSSLTLLVVPNSVLLRPSSPPSPSAADLNLRAASSPYDLADVLRYHVLLQYLSPGDLRQIPPEGKLFTTLYQTTGRASGSLGNVNLTRAAGGAVAVRTPVPFSPFIATILGFVAALPYNISVFAVDSLVIPYGFDLAASENRPPVGLNISRVLVDGHDFNVAASMLEASGMAAELEEDEGGAGITVFVPTDEAFTELPRTERLQSLPADQKAVVLRFHVLRVTRPARNSHPPRVPSSPRLPGSPSATSRPSPTAAPAADGAASLGRGARDFCPWRPSDPWGVSASHRTSCPVAAVEGAGGGGREGATATLSGPKRPESKGNIVLTHNRNRIFLFDALSLTTVNRMD